MVSTGLLSLCDHLPDPVTGAHGSQSERFADLIDIAVHGEDAGFCRIGIGEHHFGGYILPNPELLLAAIASRTTTLELGTAVTQLANSDPVRVAEDLAVLDVLSGGRADATFARGVSPQTAVAFGVAVEDLRPRFAESLRLVFRLLCEESVSWEGRYRGPLSEVRLEPRPVKPPEQMIWIGGGLSNESCDLAAELGLGFVLPSLFRYPEDYCEIVGRYRERFAATDRPEGGRLCYPSYVHVAPTSQAARARWRPYLDQYVAFATDVRGAFGRPLDFDGLTAGPAIVGSPAEVTERMAQVNDLLGVDLHLVYLDLGGIPVATVHEVIDLMGAEVIPHL